MNREVAQELLRIDSPRSVAAVLSVSYPLFVYHVYRVLPQAKYKVFTIRKRNGGTRTICAPVSALKLLQQKLNAVLQHLYEPKASVHGFVGSMRTGEKRSVITNARPHKNKKFVLNVDLADFFPSINFGRIRGMLMAPPYGFAPKVASVIAHMSVYRDESSDYLPQGAPSSPILTNMICARLDSQLRHLASDYQCVYTRYADDITFSTSLNQFPAQLAEEAKDDEGKIRFQLGKQLVGIVEENGFKVNYDKVRLQHRRSRQEVTGLIVNRKVNVPRRFVRQIRAMLHAWERYGLEAAHEEHAKKHRGNSGRYVETVGAYDKIVKGKIDYLRMVRGESDTIYLKFLNKYYALMGIRGEIAYRGDGEDAELELANSRITGLEIRVTSIEEALHKDIGPNDFSFLPEAKAVLREDLEGYSQKMNIYRKTDHFFLFCHYAFLQVEKIVRYSVRNTGTDILASERQLVERRPHLEGLLSTAHPNISPLIELTYAHWISEIREAGLCDTDKYWRLTSKTPLSGSYWVLQNLASLRNVEAHPDPDYPDRAVALRIKRDIDQATEKREKDKFSRILAFYESRQFDLVEEVLKTFLRTLAQTS